MFATSIGALVGGRRVRYNLIQVFIKVEAEIAFAFFVPYYNTGLTVPLGNVISFIAGGGFGVYWRCGKANWADKKGNSVL